MGSRKAQVLHTRLRTNCSFLNLDLFLNDISDSQLCRCGSEENVQHYFFQCRYYQAPRIDHLNSVSQYQTPSLSLLLYGNDSFSLGTNTVIFEKVDFTLSPSLSGSPSLYLSVVSDFSPIFQFYIQKLFSLLFFTCFTCSWKMISFIYVHDNLVY